MSETKRMTIPGAEEVLDLYFPVLDHGFVALVDYMGGDPAIDRAARTSYGHGTRKVNEQRGLMRYLRRHKHTTPSEMTELVFHMGLPIFVARQLVRHRTASLNEYSGRYSQMPMLFYSPKAENLGIQSKGNRQGRGDAVSEEVYESFRKSSRDTRAFAIQGYTDRLMDGVANELARIDLPLSTYTYWYWKMDLHNLLHFLGLRSDSHAQWEIRMFSDIMAGMVKRVAPDTFEAWIDYEYSATTFSRMEMEIIRSPFFTNTKDAESDVILETDSSPTYFREKDLLARGISKREIKELLMKFNEPEVPDFDLDLSKAKSPEYFDDIIAKAVPAVDK